MRRFAILLFAACGVSARLFAQVCATTPPVAQSPVNVNLAPNTSISYSWSAASGSPTGYQVFVDGDVNTPACLAPGTSCNGPGVAAGSHTWLVRAVYSTCTASSTVKSFTAGCPTSAPNQQSPSNGATNVAILPTLTWNSVQNADSYDISYSKSGQGGCTGTGTLATSTTTSFHPPPLQAGTAYEWKVAAKRSSTTCPGVPSTSCFTFTTATTACNAPGSFNLVSPSNNDTTTTTPLLSWSAASGADKYVIHLGTSNPPSPTPNDPIVSASQTSYRPSSLAAGTYYWYVDAYPNCSTTIKTSTSVSSFKVVACPTAAPTLVSPSSGAQITANSVTFQWGAVASASGYDVELSDDGGGANFSSIGVVNTTSLTKTLGNGSYIWFVRAIYGTVCPTIASGRSSFSVLAATSNCLAPQLTTPANGAINVASPVAFDWKDVDGATSYRLLAAFNGGSPTLLAVTGDSSYSGNVPGGNVEWWVEASGPNCSATSSHFIFTAVDNSGCPTNPGTPSLLAPAGGASVPSPVTFQWSTVAGASSYRVWAELGSNTTTSRVLLGTATATQLTVSVPQGKVEWLVEARFDNCPSTFSATSEFTVTTATTCNNAAPTLLLPANGATDVTSPVEFKWTEVSGATKYTLFIGSDAAGETTDHDLTRIVPAGTTSWYVVASFAGCPDVKSSVFSFTIPAAANCGGTITLLEPAAGATLPSPVNFKWSTLSGAISYRLWASFNGGPPAIIARSSDGTANGVKLPSGPIIFRIEAIFGTCSVFSAERSFTVQSAANCGNNQPVTLKTPASGATLDSEEVDFSWNATPGAALYRVWVSSNGDPFVDVGTTTDTTLHADIPNGPAIWFVESFFEGCPPLPSARASFTVKLNTARCSGDAPMTVSPADGATNVASPVTLVWSAVANAEEYRVFASLDGGDLKLIEKTSDTSVTKSLPPGVVRWLVEAVSDECPATRSTAATFTIAARQNCPTTPPQLVSPPDGANVTPPVRLDWNPVSGAVGYVVFASHNDGAPTAIGETTNTELEHRFPPGEIDWWVVAAFNGCPPLESQHFEFLIPEPENCSRTVAPLLQSPPDSATPIASPVHFEWSHVPGAQKYKVWAAIAGGGASVVGTTSNDHLDVDIPSGVVIWFVEGDFVVCPPVFSAPGTFVVRKSAPPCGTPDRPAAKAPAQVASGTPYNVRWTPVANANTFELEESLTADFANATTTSVTGLSASFRHTIVSLPTRWYYRVRALSDCNDTKSHYSKIVSVVVLPDSANAARHVSVEVGARNGVTEKVFIPGQDPPVTFTARGDRPWISVAPAAGTLGPAGVTLTVTFDPTALALGTNTGTILLTFGASSKGGAAANGTTSGGVPVNVSLVTPVQPGGKNGPLPNSLIIPAVGHAAGANNSLFESDVRIANISAQTMKYLLNFTLSNTDGTQAGQSTTIQVDPGATMALDDILANFFGIGGDGGGATGTLEIRPLTTSTSSSTTLGTTAKTSIQTVASSRTYNTTPTGTFGQFIPAIPFSQFIGSGGGRISLQQIAQSAAFRTNFGLVEAAGEKADVVVHVFDNSGSEVAAPIPISLQPGEHKQINAFLAANGISLDDGRIEVEVTSATGKVSAYASTVDNLTNDPLLVFPVLKGALTSSRYVVPGIADLNSGAASWRSDMRIFNGGANEVNVTLAYVPQPGNNGTSQTATFLLKPGEMHAIDNAVQTLFGLTNSGGSVVITTDTPSSLVATARTYNQTASGTYGQFIPGVSPAESVGLGERTLQVLQLESSTRFRTNIGVTETNGKEVTVLVTAIPSDSKIAASTTITLAPNEFRQFSIDSFNLGTLYNARVTIKVIGGSGRVTGYGSVIDQQTQDPTYVLAQ